MLLFVVYMYVFRACVDVLTASMCHVFICVTDRVVDR